MRPPCGVGSAPANHAGRVFRAATSPATFPHGIDRVSTDRLSAYSVGTMEAVMIGLIIALLVVWAILAIVGFTVKGLVWLAILGIILFAGTAAFGGFRRRSVGR
jgi:hypothetical protein